jgi:hypothetical protein
LQSYAITSVYTVWKTVPLPSARREAMHALTLQVANGMFHDPVGKHVDEADPTRVYPAIQVNVTTSPVVPDPIVNEPPARIRGTGLQAFPSQVDGRMLLHVPEVSHVCVAGPTSV